jgi:hypothetical protein
MKLIVVHKEIEPMLSELGLAFDSPMCTAEYLGEKTFEMSSAEFNMSVWHINSPKGPLHYSGRVRQNEPSLTKELPAMPGEAASLTIQVVGLLCIRRSFRCELRSGPFCERSATYLIDKDHAIKKRE